MSTNAADLLAELRELTKSAAFRRTYSKLQPLADSVMFLLVRELEKVPDTEPVAETVAETVVPAILAVALEREQAEPVAQPVVPAILAVPAIPALARVLGGTPTAEPTVTSSTTVPRSYSAVAAAVGAEAAARMRLRRRDAATGLEIASRVRTVCLQSSPANLDSSQPMQEPAPAPAGMQLTQRRITYAADTTSVAEGVAVAPGHSLTVNLYVHEPHAGGYTL